MRVAIYFKAPNDRNGNPQRGWMVHETLNQFGETNFIEEEYKGIAALREYAPEALILQTVNVTASEFRRLQKEARQ